MSDKQCKENNESGLNKSTQRNREDDAHPVDKQVNRTRDDVQKILNR
ncbi:hypothetical protein [uncultured Tolumonas sp.]|nr:hypothetical protein [uncultured Tolumonas sp.]